MAKHYRVHIRLVAVNETGRMDRATTVEQWVVFPPNSSIPGYPATGDVLDHQWVPYEDDGSGNGDALPDSESKSLSHAMSVIGDQIVKRYY